MGSIKDWLMGSGALKKAAGDSAPPAVPSVNQPAVLDIAGMAQKQADAARAKGNDQGMGSRGATTPAHPNDAAIKARAKAMPGQPTQANDAQLKGRGGDDE